MDSAGDDGSSRSDVVVLVARPGRPLVLTSEGTGETISWRLPSTVVHADPEAAEPVVSAVEDLLGGSVTLLRMGVRHEDDESRPTLITVELEPQDVEAPAGHRWVPWVELDPAAIEPRELRQPFELWIARQGYGPGPLEPPWSHAGWFARAGAWMVERMADLGRPARTRPRLHYFWGLAAVLRAEAEDGALFMKASPPFFRHEGVVTRQLAARSPGLVPTVVAIEPSEGWTLMEDNGGRLLGEEPPDRWAGGLQAFADIQRAWSGHTDELVALGARVRPLDALAAAAPSMVDHPATSPHLTPDDVRLWRAAIPSFVRACERLDQIGPAATLTHGDLHPWNVVVRESGHLVFDWTDAAVSHPFVDLLTFLIRTPDLGARRTMLASYLARWADDVPADRLEEAGELALVVSALYQVDAYLDILPRLDRADVGFLDGASASWMRRTLRVMDEGIAAAWREDDPGRSG